MSQTLFDKIWSTHVVVEPIERAPGIVYVDLHLAHEVTSPQAFDELRRRGLKVRCPDKTLATLDHSVSTLLSGHPALKIDTAADKQLRQMETNCREFGIKLHGMGDPNRGIVHVIGPELGYTQPGMTICCGDSHTSTHGAFGAWAFGIGTTQVGHVLATQCLLQRKPTPFAVNINGQLSNGVSAKDVVLALTGKLGMHGGTGHVLEYRGNVVRAMSMEERMTLCNMSIETGARAGMVAPDDTTFEYLADKPAVPRGSAWERRMAQWQTLYSDDDAVFAGSVDIDADNMGPMITYGTSPDMVIPINAPIPTSKDPTHHKALRYMGLESGKPLLGQAVNVVFIGSCTNGRISDLREAARIIQGRKVAPSVRMLVVPGSAAVKRQAEVEGLHNVFLAAGAEWREPGCSMCIAMNGDSLAPGEYAVSTSNRNFEGRQGPEGRTFLASPLTAAAAAVEGGIADPRALLADSSPSLVSTRDPSEAKHASL